jgi:hypothetical protein
MCKCWWIQDACSRRKRRHIHAVTCCCELLMACTNSNLMCMSSPAKLVIDICCAVTTVLADPMIADVLRSGDPTYAVATLIDYALAGGAPDNVSVIVADLMDTEEQADAILIGAAREDEVRGDLGEVPLPVDGPPASQSVAHALEIARQRSRWFIAGAIAATFLVLLVGRWTMGQWYVTDINGRVALYQGVSQSLGPIPLSRLDTLTDVRTDALPIFDRQQVHAGISVGSRADAEAVIARIEGVAAACVQEPSTVGCP